MDCPQSLDRLGRLLDGELPPFERDALEKHLLKCDGCRAAYANLCAGDAMLMRAFMQRRRTAALLADRVIGQLRTQHQPSWPPWVASLLAAAVGFLLAVFAIRPSRFWQEPEPLPVARLIVPTGPPAMPTTRLAQIDHAKISSLSEDEIRRFGCGVAAPLLHYVESPGSRAEERSRIAAARIASDLATETVIGDLISLLGDSEPKVRFYSATALHRMAGTDQGCPADAWEKEPGSCETALRAWQKCWQDRSGRVRMLAQ